jgi:hypothetical protein
MDLFGFFQTMIDPEERTPERVPDDQAAMSAVFKTPWIHDVGYSGRWNAASRATAVIDPENPIDGYSEVILAPGTTGGYFVTLGNDAPVDVWDEKSGATEFQLVPTLATHPNRSDLVASLGVNLCQGFRFHATTTTHEIADVAWLPKLDDNGRYTFECDLRHPSDPVATFHIGVAATNSGINVITSTNLHISYQWSTGSFGSQIISVISGAFLPTAFSFTPPVSGAFITSFNFHVHDISMSSHWVVTMLPPVEQDSVFKIPIRSATAFHYQDAPEMEALTETESERTTALTGLVTYMGSTLQDGGQISAARLGMGISPLRASNGDVYSHLASLPFYNADYALRDGAYAWWLPDSLQEYFYVPYLKNRTDTLETTSFLQYAILRDDPSQAVRLRVVQNFEMLTRSRLFTAESGPNNPSYATLAAAMKVIPAVTINSKHKGILSRALSRMSAWLNKPQNWRSLIVKGARVMDHLTTPGAA